MTLPTTLTFQSTEIRIIDRDGTPWVPAADLAKALGYAEERSVSRIYRRNADEFTEDMSVVVKLTPTGGIPTETRIFSPRGCHLIAMFARTEPAKAFRKWVLDVLENLHRAKMGEAPSDDALLPSEQQLLREIIARKVETSGGVLTYPALYARLHNKFRISSYKQLPREKLAEAIHYIERIVVEDKRKADHAPQGDLSDPVLAAIWARATKEGRRYARSVATELMKAVDRQRERMSERHLVDMVSSVELPKTGRAVIASREELWAVTARTHRAMEMLRDALEAARSLERKAGVSLIPVG